MKFKIKEAVLGLALIAAGLFGCGAGSVPVPNDAVKEGTKVCLEAERNLHKALDAQAVVCPEILAIDSTGTANADEKLRIAQDVCVNSEEIGRAAERVMTLCKAVQQVGGWL